MLEENQNIADNVDMARKNVIALVDCDSFFVSCEQAVTPELKGKPVCVMSGRGQCVISRSKEAKKTRHKNGDAVFSDRRTNEKSCFH